MPTEFPVHVITGLKASIDHLQATVAQGEQKLEDLTLANETLREENEKLREALVHVDQIVGILRHRDTHTPYVASRLREIYKIIKFTIWTPTANAADPDSF